MTNIIHFVVDRFAPQPGGLEASALRVAQILGALADTRVIVYVRSAEYVPPPDAGGASIEPRADGERAADRGEVDGIEVRALGSTRQQVEAPIAVNALFQQFDVAVARNWLDFMQVRDLIAEARDEQPSSRHVLLSFAMNHAGFVSQHVALALGLPHVTAIRGSDYSMAVHSPVFLQSLEFVMRRADFVVTTNDEQRRFVERACGRVGSVRTIHNSAPPSILRESWRAPAGDEIRIVADCGYSFHKGTHILFDAFERLAADRADLSLTLLGRRIEESGRATYWAKRSLALTERFGPRARLREHVPQQEVVQFLKESSLYCSATLGEGCSNGRVAALTIGMPIVSTRCGELADVACAAPHVRLARPGDADDFTRTLAVACEDIRRGALTVDREQVARWKQHFDRTREAEAWREVMQPLLASA